MLTVRVKKFIQRIGRNLDFKEKQPVSLDKSKIECYNCHRKGHFARECRSGRNQGRRSYSDNGRSNAQTNESSSQALVAQDGLGGYDWSNDFEVEPVNYALMAISSSSSSSSSDSEIALESLESRILGHEKNELAWGEKYEFQNYELKCREIKISNLNLELEKVGKERDELKDKIAKWEESTKNPDEILNNQVMKRIHKKMIDFFHSKLGIMMFDEYAIRKKIIESKTTDLNTKTSETIDDEDDVSEVQTFSPVKTNESQKVKPRVDKIGQTFQKQRIGFKKIKACFVYKSTNHLIKDYNFHDKKSQEPKLKNVVNTGPRVNKLVWDNSKRGIPEICYRIMQCFKLLDESQVVLMAPRKDDVYSLDLKNIVPFGAMDDVSRQAFEEKRGELHSQKKGKLKLQPSVSIASTPTRTNAGVSSFVYLGGIIPIDASTLPNVDLPMITNLPNFRRCSDTLPNDGIFNKAYDDDEDVGAVADFNNMDNTIAVSPIPTLRIHKDHPYGQILGDPTSAVQTRGKI
ncbi:ribonuclease H-like domain-containing protein [Tanacetum coccineum]